MCVHGGVGFGKRAWEAGDDGIRRVADGARYTDAGKGVHDLLDEGFTLATGKVRGHDAEFVATESGDDVPLWNGVADSLSGGLDVAVSGGVSLCIDDSFEAVKVDD